MVAGEFGCVLVPMFLTGLSSFPQSDVTLTLFIFLQLTKLFQKVLFLILSFMCMCVYVVNATCVKVASEARRGHQIPKS